MRPDDTRFWRVFYYLTEPYVWDWLLPLVRQAVLWLLYAFLTTVTLTAVVVTAWFVLGLAARYREPLPESLREREEARLDQADKKTAADLWTRIRAIEAEQKAVVRDETVGVAGRMEKHVALSRERAGVEAELRAVTKRLDDRQLERVRRQQESLSGRGSP